MQITKGRLASLLICGLLAVFAGFYLWHVRRIESFESRVRDILLTADRVVVSRGNTTATAGREVTARSDLTAIADAVQFRSAQRSEPLSLACGDRCVSVTAFTEGVARLDILAVGDVVLVRIGDSHFECRTTGTGFYKIVFSIVRR